ncbi:MAG: 3-hydroxybutyryl-CoA dehydrogenase [Chloroflexi bacterium AL-W]|nr:3-hydroxybutyryl-CoA dehydrogenase [Chloroflexi bacterium AL-N1]NOK71541.1 3-hydroxybutyryl-CoA dehydrogenase [Chloroflexi bacterium AL-N10]NOK78887.1 3-hydroxybutyryl-CoA dehydrogenase [Chloroflexi bacterium AL-N5]NOK86363.1 3-hydroxybutyryl-CoA dehydrogenase [Chloroflexi bacterium AL-W]NOK93332.1 3-hydroxybutyryl-CoA dehydrogenase [Chloroflexi bacterium AL-N15]
MHHETIAILGSGTMGSGIAQAALVAGLPVILYDIDDQALERARQCIGKGLEKQGHPHLVEHLRLVTVLADIASASLVIEAVPEQIELKRELFARVGSICPAPCVITSNTSSLPIMSFASVCQDPQRVAGLHFFNPVHRMALVEVIQTNQTDALTIETLLGFVERLGKTPVLARDTPGFIVNRVARPFYGEALRMFGERIATHTDIDTIIHKAGGFPLGPFALMDLIGIDVNFAVTCSMYEQSFGEPRYRPHLIQQQMVLAGTIGRKTGQGFYTYNDNTPTANQATADAQPLSGGVLMGGGSWAPGLADLCTHHGLRVIRPKPDSDGEDSAIAPVFESQLSIQKEVHTAFVIAGNREHADEQIATFDRLLPAKLPIFAQCCDIPLGELAVSLRHPERLVGFDGLFTDSIMTLVALPCLSDEARTSAEALVRGLGRQPIWITDTPALVLPRVVTMLANEAAFAFGEGIADADTIDTAIRLGANHPIGPLARAQQIGYKKIVAILDHLHAEYGEERYRVAPALRRAARLGKL